MRTIVILTALLLSVAIAFAQNNAKIIQKEVDKNEKITFAKFDKNKYATDNFSTIQFLEQLNNNKNINLSYQFKQEQKQDELGYIHKEYQQYYKGLRIVGATYAVHNKMESIEFLNGEFAEIKALSIIPTLAKEKAIDIAKQEAIKKYKMVTEKNIAIETLVVCRDEFSEKKEYRLAYHINIKSENDLIDEIYYIDANTGKILNKEFKICYANTTTGIAQTVYSGTQNYSNGIPIPSPNFVTDSYNGSYRLREVRQGVTIITLNNLNHSSSDIGSAIDFTDNDNNWAQAEMGNNKYALDAHWGAEKVFDYWKNVHGRNSIDNNGIMIKNYVHSIIGGSNSNAQWIPSTNSMHYGDGDGTTFKNFATLDFCAHELGHGICQYTSGLTPGTAESGALNEGFSDIWGAVVENWAMPNSPPKNKWAIGEEMYIPYPYKIRDLSNPSSGGYLAQPDTYNGTFWGALGNDPHINSGVLNYWFYLLSDGGSGTNDPPINNLYAVTGIGITKAANIAYKTEQLLSSGANFVQARTMSIQAAQLLYGVGSCEEIAVTKAWYAVGVGANYVVPTLSISGANSICTPNGTATYSFSGIVPTNATIIWNVSPLNILNIPPNSNVNTVVGTRNGIANGLVTLTATVTVCGQTLTIPPKFINVGNPYALYNVNGCGFQEAAMETAQDNGPCNVQCYTPGGPNKTWCAPTAYNATSVTWQKMWSFPANYSFWSATNDNISLLFKAANQSVELKRTIVGACVENIEQYFCFSSNNTLCTSLQAPTNTSTQLLKVYPNPTSVNNAISLELLSNDKLNKFDFENATIQLVDANDNIILQKQGNKIAKESLEIPALSNGTYYVRVINKNGVQTEQIIVKN